MECRVIVSQLRAQAYLSASTLSWFLENPASRLSLDCCFVKLSVDPVCLNGQQVTGTSSFPWPPLADAAPNCCPQLLHRALKLSMVGSAGGTDWDLAALSFAETGANTIL